MKIPKISFPKSSQKKEKRKRSLRSRERKNTPTRTYPYKPRTLKKYQNIWFWLIVTLPLDVLLFSELGGELSKVLLPLSQYLYNSSLAFSTGLFLLIPISLLLSPLYKKNLVETLLFSQQYQNDAEDLKGIFHYLLSSLIGMYVVISMLSNILPLDTSYFVIFITLCLFLFPSWYKKMKKNTMDISIADTKEETPHAKNHTTMTFHKLNSSAKQMDQLLLLLCYANRLSLPLLLISLSAQNSSSLVAIFISFITAFLSLLALRPEKSDLWSVCRSCGLWSRRAHQFDGFCPGCTSLALKSNRTQPKRKNHFEAVQKILKKIDNVVDRPKNSEKKAPRR